MKKLIFTLFAAVLVATACNSVDKKEKETQDSIAQAAEADSILNAAMAADTLSADSSGLDTVVVDSIK
ncbi:hypothetical protein [Daejeonella lutea]|uniref:Lipoprotein n=1 Tax=Daejeonella lutea TaxID=572036 RepID=A0A1T5E9N5_9SPHI|nr:hypothetical protein [Daejeonella lutea]SKB80727.1 hypothetical protein SAMN05661099_2818 [Daejeonella lutea]